jgi:hypothetical protein
MNLLECVGIYLNDLEASMISCNNSGMKFCGGVGAVRLCLLILLAPLFLFAADNSIPEGTRITLQLNETLSTKSNLEGDTFTAVVTIPVYIGERVVISKGSIVNGSVSRIMRPGRLKGRALMDLIFQSIKIPGRKQMSIVASLIPMDIEGSGRVRAEGRVEGESSAGSDAGKVIIPSLAGAGIGGLAGGGKGAGIGAGVGAVAGLASIFTSRGKDIEIQRGSTMDIKLDRPLILPAEGDDSALK